MSLKTFRELLHHFSKDMTRGQHQRERERERERERRGSSELWVNLPVVALIQAIPVWPILLVSTPSLFYVNRFNMTHFQHTHTHTHKQTCAAVKFYFL